MASTGLPDFDGNAFFMGGAGGGAAAPKNLWVAAADGEVETVRAHLDAGVSADAPDENGYTACHAAASYGHVPVLELLLARGGPVDARDEDGDTPLHAAETEAVIRWLLAHGADAQVRNAEGRTPLEEAESEGNHAVAAVWRGILGLPPAPVEEGGAEGDADMSFTMDQVREMAANQQDGVGGGQSPEEEED